MSSTKTDLVVFDQLQSDITTLVAPVLTMKVTDFDSAQQAIDAVKQVKDYSKQVDQARRSLVDPLNARVKSINEYAKNIEKPLLAAEAYIKAKLVEFEVAQEKIRAEARRKAEEEQRRIEAELREKQEAERLELEQRQLDSKEAAAIFGEDTEGPAVTEAEVQALEEKAIEEQAAIRQEFADKTYNIDQQGIKNTKKTWKCELVDINLVPKEYLLQSLNTQAVLAMARAGITNIPGVRVWQEATIAIGRNTYAPPAKRQLR